MWLSLSPVKSQIGSKFATMNSEPIWMIGRLPLWNIYVIQVPKLTKVFGGVHLSLFGTMISYIEELLKACCLSTWILIKQRLLWETFMFIPRHQRGIASCCLLQITLQSGLNVVIHKELMAKLCQVTRLWSSLSKRKLRTILGDGKRLVLPEL